MNAAFHNVYDDESRARAYAELEFPGTYYLAYRDLPAILAEHVQGNHFLRPEQIETEFVNVGMQVETYLFANDNEAVVVGRKPA